MDLGRGLILRAISRHCPRDRDDFLAKPRAARGFNRVSRVVLASPLLSAHVVQEFPTTIKEKGEERERPFAFALEDHSLSNLLNESFARAICSSDLLLQAAPRAELERRVCKI